MVFEISLQTSYLQMQETAGETRWISPVNNFYLHFGPLLLQYGIQVVNPLFEAGIKNLIVRGKCKK